MNRPARIVLEVLGPPLIAAVIFRIWRSLWHGGPLILSPDASLLADFAVLLAFAYGFAGIQSFVFAAILETSFSLGLRVRSWKTIALSSGLGLLSGAAIPSVFGGDAGRDPQMFVELTALGLLTGAVIGAILVGFAGPPKAGPDALSATRGAT